MTLEQQQSCPECGSYAILPTSDPDEEGQVEFHCDDCGEYFVDEFPKETTP
jgi:transposase-like protein